MSDNATITRSSADQVRAVIANLEMARQVEESNMEHHHAAGRHVNAAVAMGKASSFREALQLIQVECADLLGG